MSFEKTTVSGLVKDTRTGAVLNTNTGEYAAILAQRRKNREIQELQNAVYSLQQRIENLETLIRNAGL